MFLHLLIKMIKPFVLNVIICLTSLLSSYFILFFNVSLLYAVIIFNLGANVPNLPPNFEVKHGTSSLYSSTLLKFFFNLYFSIYVNNETIFMLPMILNEEVSPLRVFGCFFFFWSNLSF